MLVLAAALGSKFLAESGGYLEKAKNQFIRKIFDPFH